MIALLSFTVCLPWMFRNRVRLGTFSVRDNLGLELQANNNAFATAATEVSPKSKQVYHPNLNVEQARLVKSLGEVRYNDLKREQAIEWIRNNPRDFVSLCLRRIARFWFPLSMPFAIGVWIITLASIPASIHVVLKKRGSAAFWALLSMLAFSLPYYLILGDLRYRIPVLWVTALFACYASAEIWAVFSPRRKTCLSSMPVGDTRA